MTSSSPTDRTGAGDATTEACAPDCAERTACPVVGEPGHWQCGTCPEHQRPRHHCGCLAAPGPVDRRDADDATFRATLARLEAAPLVDESAVEVVARAMTEPMPEWRGGSDADYWRMRASRVLAALKPAPGTDSSGQAADEDVHEPYNDDGALYCGWTGDGGTFGGCGHAWPCPTVTARAAVAGPQRDHGGEGGQ